MEVAEHDGRTYYKFELEPPHVLITATAVGNQLYLFNITGKGPQWKSEVQVEGLQTLDYQDNLQDRERFTEQADAVTFESEVDKIYLSTPTKIAILDHEKKTFVLRKDGLPDAVIWNPWDKKAKAMPDFGDDEYKTHVMCGSCSC